MTDLRTGTDSLGPKQLPREAVWGIHTARALENFPITGVPPAHLPELVRALAMVKKAAALANRDLGALEAGLAAAIAAACDEIIAGHHHEHFVVDMIQGGAGTSTNMNANEVIANLALQALVRRRRAGMRSRRGDCWRWRRSTTVAAERRRRDRRHRSAGHP